jgi:hypothetical protein
VGDSPEAAALAHADLVAKLNNSRQEATMRTAYEGEHKVGDECGPAHPAAR